MKQFILLLGSLLVFNCSNSQELGFYEALKNKQISDYLKNDSLTDTTLVLKIIDLNSRINGLSNNIIESKKYYYESERVFYKSLILGIIGNGLGIILASNQSKLAFPVILVTNGVNLVFAIQYKSKKNKMYEKLYSSF